MNRVSDCVPTASRGHRPRRTPKRLVGLVLALAWLLALGAALGQQKHNFLAVDDQIRDDIGPFYFIDQGDSSNAYAKAQPLAEAMGYRLDYDSAGRALVFEGRGRLVRLAATSDISTALEKRSGVLDAAGRDIPSPMGILVDGVSYVAITPIVAALGGDSGWHPGPRLVTIESPTRLAPTLGRPRLGLSDGVSRVAIDLPEDQAWEAAVGDDALVLSFPGTRAEAFERRPDDPNLAAVRLEPVGGGSRLVVLSRHALAADGHGFRIGRLELDGKDVVYVDLAPGLQGDSVAALVGESLAVPQAAAPARPRRVVVIDAGHGGHDPGTLSDWAREEDVVLAIALKLQALLEGSGVEVILTRDRDTYPSFEQRSGLATPERNLFVSIHANAATSSQAQGVETWVFGRPLNPDLISQAIRENGGGELGQVRTQQALERANSIAGSVLAQNQLNYSMALAETVQDSLVRATGARDRGVRQNVFYVLRNARTPAILVEVGFVSHPEEGRRLASDAYQTTVAEALARGILDFLESGGVVASR